MEQAKERETLLDWFHHWELTQSQRTYLTQPDKGEVADYTWAEVGCQARSMAAHLKSLNLKPASSIGILSKNCAHWIIADLAIWMAGHVSVPLYTTLKTGTAAYILRHARVKLLFVGKLDASDWSKLHPHLPKALRQIALPLAPSADIPQWSDVIARTAPLQEISRREPGDLATIVYTSGSTGNPKGVMLSFHAMISAPISGQQMMNLHSGDRMLSYLPLAHVAERAAVEASSLLSGFHVYFSDSLTTFMDDMRRARPTLFFSVPRLWTKFYQDVLQKLPSKRQKLLFGTPIIGGIVKRKLLRELGLDHVRFAVTGAAPLPPNIFNWYQELGLELLEAYGMSENFTNSHMSRPAQACAGTVGQPLPSVQCRLGDDGEVLVKSPSNMMAYFRNKAQTAKVIDGDGWLHTGDRGEIDAAGRLKIIGRIKEIFKTSKGRYVAPAPIENLLAGHASIDIACVCGAGCSQPYALLMLGERARAALLHNAEDRVLLDRELSQFLDELNGELEPHEAMDFVVVVKEPWEIANGLLTPTLKIKRAAIEAHYSALIDGWASRRRKVVWE